MKNFKFRSFIAVALLGVLISAPARALDIVFAPVAPGVYVHVGETGPRTPANEGLNANIGLIVTATGAVLIDSGATYQSARKIQAAAMRVTTQPIRWVINTGDQDHRWLGNGFFREQGAEIIAHQAGKADMLNRGGEQVETLRSSLGELSKGTVPVLATRWIDKADETLDLGGVVVELKHRGGAHTPGDMLVWLPQKKVLFSGDAVYVDRMLGVLPVSNTRYWLATLAEIDRIAPAKIVPGHGQVTNLATAQAQSRDYLLALRAHMKKAHDEGLDMSAAIKSFEARPFMNLLNAAELMPGNASRTYLEMERE